MIEVSVCDIEPEKLQKNMKNNYHQYSDHPENTSDILVFFSFCMYMYMCVHTHTQTRVCVCNSVNILITTFFGNVLFSNSMINVVTNGNFFD